jgi:hypothetical protein
MACLQDLKDRVEQMNLTGKETGCLTSSRRTTGVIRCCGGIQRRWRRRRGTTRALVWRARGRGTGRRGLSSALPCRRTPSTASSRLTGRRGSSSPPSRGRSIWSSGLSAARPSLLGCSTEGAPAVKVRVAPSRLVVCPYSPFAVSRSPGTRWRAALRASGWRVGATQVELSWGRIR